MHNESNSQLLDQIAVGLERLRWACRSRAEDPSRQALGIRGTKSRRSERVTPCRLATEEKLSIILGTALGPGQLHEYAHLIDKCVCRREG